MKQSVEYEESAGLEMGVKPRAWKKVLITAFQEIYKGLHFIFISSNETRGHMLSVFKVFISMYWLPNIQIDGRQLLRAKVFRMCEEINLKIIVFTNCILSISHVNMYNI